MSDDESEVMARWWHPAKGDVVFDVGCATGNWSIPAMRAGAFVYAFDPDPTAYAQFKFNTDKWGFTPGNFLIMNVALGAENNDYWSIKDEWLKMGVPLSVMTEYLDRLDSSGGYVTLRTLDHYADMVGDRIDWIKIDVEGFEYDVVKGGIELLKKYHPRLIVENHSNVEHIGPYAARRWPLLLVLLEDLGYQTTEVPYDQRSHLYAEVKK